MIDGHWAKALVPLTATTTRWHSAAAARSRSSSPAVSSVAALVTRTTADAPEAARSRRVPAGVHTSVIGGVSTSTRPRSRVGDGTPTSTRRSAQSLSGLVVLDASPIASANGTSRCDGPGSLDVRSKTSPPS